MWGSQAVVCHPFGLWQHEEQGLPLEPSEYPGDESWQRGESSEEEPGLLQIGGSSGHIYYHYWSCQLRFNRGLQMDVSGPASTLPHPSTGSQLQPHLCSLNPLISPEPRVRSEALQPLCLGSTTSPPMNHSQEMMGGIGALGSFKNPRINAQGQFFHNQVSGKLHRNSLIF